MGRLQAGGGTEKRQSGPDAGPELLLFFTSSQYMDQTTQQYKGQTSFLPFGKSV